jgi:ABC-type glycerol-3-phosphate transport system substrate-binding protein
MTTTGRWPLQGVSRRKALKLGAATAALPLVHIRTGRAAGKLTAGFWDHWVPGGSDVLRKQCEAWASKNQVDITVDFITSVGNKLVLTQAAEDQAGTGHDVLHFTQWEIHNHADKLESVDDVVGRLTAKYGGLRKLPEYLGRVNGHWLAVPSSWGAQAKPPCARISVLKKAAGLDVTQMYPARAEYTPGMDEWTWDAHLRAAEACNAAGMPFGIGLGGTADSVDTAGAMFQAFGAAVIDAKGEIRVDSDAVHQVLEYGQKLVKVLSADAVSYDDASNNRALISGRSAMIWNPPSAWAVAKRDAPQIAADCWTFSAPKGPAGRFVPFSQSFWGIWKFAQNKSAGKELIEYLMQREQVEERCQKVSGYDIPPFTSMLDFPVWQEVEPPKGTVFNYPVRETHHAEPNTAGAPAPPGIAVQIYQRGIHTAMLAKLKSGQSIPQVIAWAKDELEGFLR